MITDDIYKVMKWDTNEGCQDSFNDLADKITREHRTTQQNIVRNLRSFCETLEKKMSERGTDLRNEGSLEWLKNAKEGGLPYV